MDYAIYKTTNGAYQRRIYTFLQSECAHRAKRAAIEKLQQMWLRVLRMPTTNRDGSNEEFSYDHIALDGTKERIRFFIAKL